MCFRERRLCTVERRVVLRFGFSSADIEVVLNSGKIKPRHDDLLVSTVVILKFVQKERRLLDDLFLHLA